MPSPCYNGSPVNPRRVRILLALAMAPAPALAAAGGGSLTVATYNVENYGPADRMTPGGFRLGYPKPEAEKRALRGVIGRLGADVLALQEMGGQAHLEELRADLRAEGIDYPHSAWMQGEDPERHLALLSKLPLRDVRRHDSLEFAYLGGRQRMKRGLLEASVSAGGGEVTLFVVHLKSRLTERRDDPGGAVRREAEAAQVRSCVLRRFPDPASARFVILGDFNDGSSSRTLRIVSRKGAAVVSVPLEAADSRGEAWTESWDKGEGYSRLDLILVSPGLRPSVDGGRARIYDGPDASGASDHRPVLMGLTFPKR